MKRHVFALVVLVSLPAAPILGENPAKKNTNPNDVEVRFADGSVLHMAVRQESLEVATKYGKLTVPISDIRKIEFASRMSEATSKKVESAVNRLSDESFDRRQEATKELIELGASAFPAVLAASKSKDNEVARRAQEILQQIRDKVPAAQLKLRNDDEVRAEGFTIVGRITSSTIKAQSNYFGDSQLNVVDLRGMRWLGFGGELSVSIDAAKYGGVQNQWLETDLAVSAHENLVIVASGQVDLMPDEGGEFIAGPAGFQKGGFRQGRGKNGLAPGSLLGRIGENGKTFVIGERFEGPAEGEGKLYLQIAPGPWENTSTGNYQVKVTAGK